MHRMMASIIIIIDPNIGNYEDMEEQRWTETPDRETNEEYLETLGVDKVFNGDLGVHRGRHC